MGFFDFLFEDKKLLNESYRTDDLILPEQIALHFDSVIKENIQISVSVKVSPKTTYGSFIGEIDKGENGGLLIDLLIPNEGDKVIQKEKKLSLSYFMDGAAFSFQTSHIGVVTNKFDYHKLRIPKRISKFQKRKTFRITSSSLNPVYADLGAGKEEIFDISVGGISLFSSANLVRYEHSKDKLTAAIKLPDSVGEVTVEAIVRKSFDQTKKVDGVMKRKYSLQFIKLKESEASAISLYMMNRQREISAHS